MRWHIIAIGKPKLEYARLGIGEYAGRLKPFAPVTLHYLKAASREVIGSRKKSVPNPWSI